jgi:hypothetical protein
MVDLGVSQDLFNGLKNAVLLVAQRHDAIDHKLLDELVLLG